MAWTTFVVIAVFFLVPMSVRAEYVLPYPSYMPGNKLYRISRLIDRIKKPFYFGNISSVKYHLGLSDKYLVEAKTLFEYKQYLLAIDALSRSDTEFTKAPAYIKRAKSEKKEVRNFETQLQEAAEAHQLILKNLREAVPEQFLWTPEKEKSINLPLEDLINSSITLRSY
ncbi:MAG TPA: DUF5667 domain-containing protein [Patescibacteria group bacterium]|nr:DUF5667 domain-containing protein [Patescibacteria group bacterium]